MNEILHIYFANPFSLHVEVGFIVLAFIFACFVVYLFKNPFNKKGSRFFRSDIELNIGLGNIGNVKIKPNHEVEQIAHKAWAELATRKAGLLFEMDHDVIVDIYDSWYFLFGEIRNLIKQIPASRLQNEDTQKIIGLLVESLNRGLRPHLTKWQAKFRRWYNEEIKKYPDKTPQQIQKMYPEYDALISDLVDINIKLVSYTQEIKKLTT